MVNIHFKINDVWRSLLDLLYPYGSVYYTLNSTSPSEIIGGTWTAIEGYFLQNVFPDYYEPLLNVYGSFPAGATTVTLTAAQAPQRAHYHTFSHTHRSYPDSQATTFDGSKGLAWPVLYDGTYAEIAAASATSGHWVPEVYKDNANFISLDHYAHKSITATSTGSFSDQNATSAHNNLPQYLKTRIYYRTDA